MKKFLVIIGLLVIVGAGSAFSAKVTGVNIFRSGQNTVAQIDVEGDVRFSHQTEIAKDGKPFRIIVDILAATHEMGSKSFEGLPDCRIVGIRSSQYAVDPEQIVRIVLDMKAESEYQIESEENSVILYINDPDAKNFQFWSSQDFMSDIELAIAPSQPAIEPTVESTKTAEAQPDIASIIAAINESIDADRMSSLEPGTENPKKSQTESQENKEPSASDIDIAGPQLAQEDLGPVIEEQPAIESETEIIGPVVSTDENATVETNKPEVAKSDVKAEPAKVNSTNKAETKEEPKKVEESKPAEPTKKTLGNSQKTTLPTPPNKTESRKLADATTTDDNSSTARFRRSPVSSRKIKGTLVAEFPTRLVMKYQGKKYRDPFETLINETKVTQSPMEARVPNVEGLKLVGILESPGSGNRALFEDKDSYGYILKAGDKVQKGYVLRVDNDKVYFQVFEYGWSRTVALDMDIF